MGATQPEQHDEAAEHRGEQRKAAEGADEPLIRLGEEPLAAC
jgi:hypothetical protein